MTDISQKVREANASIYDAFGKDYEKIDGRRSRELLRWLRARLTEARGLSAGGMNLLDVGCGSGFVLRAAKGVYSNLYGLDISSNILKGLSSQGIFPFCGDAEHIPLKDASVDTVVFFAAIHHFYDHRPILREAHRVLKNGGVIYIDHDMSKHFFNRFGLLIKLYRALSSKERMVKKIGVSEIYHLSEIHADGIDARAVIRDLESLGFSIVKCYHHWYGLTPLTDRIFGERHYSEVSAPLAALIARKKE